MDIVVATGVYFTSGRKREESSRKVKNHRQVTNLDYLNQTKFCGQIWILREKYFAPWHGNLSQQTEIVTE